MRKMKLTKFTVSILLLLALTVGFVGAVTLNKVDPQFLGFYTQSIEDSKLQVTSAEHVIISTSQVESSITVYNGDSSNVHNATVYVTYLDSVGTVLASDKFNVKLDPLADKTKTITVMLDVSKWTETTYSIVET